MEEDQGVWIHQEAWFHLGEFEEGISTSYTLKKEDNGVYLFLLEGELVVENQLLERRDGMGIQGVKEISFYSNAFSKVLLMEVPMYF